MVTLLVIVMMVVLIVLCYVLLAPIYLEVNTREGLYRIKFHVVTSSQICFEYDSIILKIQLAGWHKEIDLLAEQKHAQRVDDNTKPGKDKRRGSVSFHKIERVLQSFKLTKCYITLDTGDEALNGILFPGFVWLAIAIKKDVGINFRNENVIILEVRNSFFRIIRAYLYA